MVIPILSSYLYQMEQHLKQVILYAYPYMEMVVLEVRDKHLQLVALA